VQLKIGVESMICVELISALENANNAQQINKIDAACIEN